MGVMNGGGGGIVIGFFVFVDTSRTPVTSLRDVFILLRARTRSTRPGASGEKS